MNARINTYLTLLIVCSICFSQIKIVPAKAVGVQFVETSLDQVKEMATKENKIIFFDAYTTWCAPCKQMDKEVFIDASVADFFNSNFINAKFDMEKGEGLELKAKYGVQAFPTYIFLDATGNMIHQIVGFFKAEKLLEEAQKVLDNNGNVLSVMQARFESGERAEVFLLSYLDILNKSFDREKAQQVAIELLNSQNKEELLGEGSWAIFSKNVNDPYSQPFNNFLSNFDQFEERYGKQKVEMKIKQAYLIHGRSYFIKDENYKLLRFDKKGFKNHLTEARKLQTSNRTSIEAELGLMRARELSKWSKYVSRINTGIADGTLSGSSMALYNYAIAVNNGQKALKKDYENASDWVAECIAQNTMPQALNNYNKLYADLLEKAGLTSQAEKVRSQIK
ncbi:MAG: thioredoxin fold domain-containing protein [Ekhidna sp.]|nr:thioredoxin fold domain-containing protein [Ekhidna sp.]